MHHVRAPRRADRLEMGDPGTLIEESGTNKAWNGAAAVKRSTVIIPPLGVNGNGAEVLAGSGQEAGAKGGGLGRRCGGEAAKIQVGGALDSGAAQCYTTYCRQCAVDRFNTGVSLTR